MKHLLIALVAAAALLFVHEANAATQLYFDVPASPVAAGEAFSVRALVDSDQSVNAYAVTVDYSGPVELTGVNNAHSLITVSQGAPDISQAGEVKWVGGSIDPFSGTGGEILTFNFLATGTGTAMLSFRDPAIYLANGKGTKVVPSAASATVAISGSVPPGSDGSQNPGQIQPADLLPPEITFLSIINNPLDAGQKLLSFSAADPGSGVKTIMMRYRTALVWSAWQAANNPEPLPQGVWEVGFKVVDNAGNTAERTIYDLAALLNYALIAAAVVIVVIAAFVLAGRSRRRRV